MTASIEKTLCLIGLSLVSLTCFGGDKSIVIDDKCPVECCKEDPALCDIFGLSTLYKNENACLVQSVALVGRYHGQYLSHNLKYSNPNIQDEGAHYWEHRRFRLGTKVQFLNDFTFFNNWNISDGIGDNASEKLAESDFWGNIYEMYIKWEPSSFPIEGFYIQAGKQEQKLTREFSTSSKKILTFERSHIVNEVTDHTPWGIVFGFDYLNLEHQLGAWLGGQEESADGAGPNWPDSGDHAGRASLSYKVKYDFSENTDVFFDYAYTNNDNGRQSGHGTSDFDNVNPYNHVFALGTESSWDIGHCDRKYGLITDVIWGIDRDQQNNTVAGGVANNNRFDAGVDTWGVVILPYYDVTERFQLVGKYAYASAARLQRPFRRDNQGGINRDNLSDIHTLYLGFNYRLCGDNFKFMGGYEFLDADLYENALAAGDLGSVTGDSWMFGFRTFW